MFDLKKFFAGFMIWRGEKIGKIIYYVVIFLICFGVYNRLFLRRDTVINQRTIIEKAENIKIQGPQDHKSEKEAFFLGLKVFRLKIGIKI